MLGGAGCETPRPTAAAIVGTLSSREPVPIPPNAVAQVRLVEVSRSGRAPLVIAEATLTDLGSMPIGYRLSYPLAAYRPGMQYAVQGSILVDGRPWMVTETVNHFLDWGTIVRADVFLQRAP